MLVDGHNAFGLTELHDHASVRVEEQLAVEAAEERLWDCFPFDPGDTTTAGRHSEELFGERAPVTVGASCLRKELLLDPSGRGDHVLVSLDGQLAELGVKLLEDFPLGHEVGQRRLSALRHVEMVAE